MLCPAGRASQSGRARQEISLPPDGWEGAEPLALLSTARALGESVRSVPTTQRRKEGSMPRSTNRDRTESEEQELQDAEAAEAELREAEQQEREMEKRDQ